ncbi:unnamed protein product, partial [Rotaria magnacalcarata]
IKQQNFVIKLKKQMQEKITDTTGREQRILRNYDSITTKQVFSLNELTHNLDLVIESCEESMIRSHRRCEQCVNQVENISNLFFLQQIFDELKRNYNKEYKKYRLWDLEGSVLHGYLKEHLTSNWNIYDDDQELIDLFWK